MSDLQRAIDLLTALTIRRMAETVEDPVTAPVSYVVRDIPDSPHGGQSFEWQLDLGSGVVVPLRTKGSSLVKTSTEDIAELAEEFVMAAESCWCQRQDLITEFNQARDIVDREIKRLHPASWCVDYELRYINEYDVPEEEADLVVTVERHMGSHVARGTFEDLETFKKNFETWLSQNPGGQAAYFHCDSAGFGVSACRSSVMDKDELHIAPLA